jgi:alpha-glucosidase (family GH31 glycosyl hydrolase)
VEIHHECGAGVKRTNNSWRAIQPQFCFVILLAIVAGMVGKARAQHPTEDPHAHDSVADHRAVVVVDHARFTVLTPQLIRLEWAADGKFEDHPSFVFLNRHLPVPQYTKGSDGRQFTIDTADLHLVYGASANGKFTPDNLTITFKLNGKPVTWHPGMEDTGNLQGTTRTLDGAKGNETKEPIGQGLISRDGWTVVDDSARPLFDSANFTFAQGEKSPWPWVMMRPAGDRQDLYFFGYGHNYKQALADYVKVAGRIPVPPRFAFGIWWSRYWAYSDQELETLVRGFHENDLPLDVLVIDMDWHLNRGQLEAMHEKDESGQSLGWSGYTWNPLLFPDPKAFLDNVHQEGLKVTLNLHPASGVQPWEKAYPAMARAMGIDPATRKYVPFDITNKKFATNYMDLLHHPLERQGINFWWLDWQQESSTNIPGVNPTWWLNYVHFTDQQREGKRPLLFHRWGGLGNHRYQIGFSGDTISTWDSLAFQPWFTATAANVGYAYWSHDIGGHMPGVVAPELITRWIQFGAYSPILRTHTTKNPDSERRIWAYPEPYADIMRSTFQAREALQPYLYTEARRTYDSGVAFLHPLYYDWPEAEAAYSHKDEYVFGSQMIVAPVTAPVDERTQLAKQNVWIPEGDWIEENSGKHFAGPAEQSRSFSIDETPVYVRAGAIVPMQPPMSHVDQKPVDPLIVNVYPIADHKSSEYRLYADGSDSEAYQRGVCTWTKITAAQTGDDLAVAVAPVEGRYAGMITERAYEIRLPGDWPPDSVVVNGRPLNFTGHDSAKPGWRYEGNSLTTVIRTPRYPVHTPVRIEVRQANGSLASRRQLDGFAGAVDRLHDAYNTLNALEDLRTHSPDSLIDAWQTGDRMSYHPEKARNEISRFPKVYEQAMGDVKNMVDSANVSEEELEKRLNQHHRSGADRDRVAHYKEYLGRALALLEDAKPQ